MANRYGLDASYFTSKLEQLIRDIDNYTPDEFARVMARMSKTADKNVVLEPEFQSNESWVHVGEKLPTPAEGIEYLCVDYDGVRWLCEYDYNQDDEAVFTVLGSAAQPKIGSIVYWSEIQEHPPINTNS
ncbi:hypothetical protein [Pseudoalteromonas spongiae]|uniref:hypothetical protein n=1 Tax=Pseudoalteromonas spongiae TaxID=298657 RepID=UPI000C2D0AA1|nr:hypothetical protein [Pseudoalteromonas spongiae]